MNHSLSPVSVDLPNRLIEEDLHYTSRRLAAVLYGLSDEAGQTKTTFSSLHDLTDIATCTIRKARVELEEKGFLHYWVVNNSTIYSMIQSQPCFSVPRCLLLQRHDDTTHSAFSVLLYQHFFAQQSNDHGPPSIGQTRKALWISRSTVCCGRKRIRAE
jgi:hypothetical protein